MEFVLVVSGAMLLYLGGELLVRNASHLAARLGVSTLVIGLTVVAFGTSSPELAATLMSALRGAPEVAAGNVVGSNIANVGLILGLTAILYPLTAGTRFLLREVPVMIAVCALLYPLFVDGRVERWEGILLCALLLIYLWVLFRRDARSLEGFETAAGGPMSRSVLGVVAGVVLLVLGARFLVDGAVSLAESLGVPERVIGLTLVAFGTSLPELASSLVAAMRRETDIILGNIVGSNMLNILAILGVTVLVRPIRLEADGLVLDLLVMVLFSLAILPLTWRRRRLGRWGGSLLVAAYAAYLILLFA